MVGGGRQRDRKCVGVFFVGKQRLERFGEVWGGLESGKVVFGTGQVVLESFDEF